MAAIIECFLMCDKCPTTFGVDSKAIFNTTKQREEAKKNGWKYSGNRDYCPDCKFKPKGRTKKINP